MVKAVWSVTLRMIGRHPSVLVPFFLKALFEGLVLTVLFYYPRPPLSVVFAEPVKTFFGPAFLHYPYNFNLLPTLYYYGQLVSMVIFGVIMYGMAMSLVSQAHSADEEVRLFGSFNRAVRRYFPLLGIWIVISVLSALVLSGPSFIIKKTMQPTPAAITLVYIFSYAGIAAAFLVETLFIYSYPAIIIERSGFIASISRSFGMAKKLFLTTVCIVFIPRLLEVLFMFVKQKQQGIMNLTVPEMMLVILGAGIVVSFVTDSLVFLSAANLFILKQENEKGKD